MKIKDDRLQMNKQTDIKLTVEVEISEMLGSEKIAYFNIGDKKCSSKLDADCTIGKTIELSFMSSNLYKFDSATGARIY